MGYEIGVACGSCDGFSPLAAKFCALCGAPLSLLGQGPSVPAVAQAKASEPALAAASLPRHVAPSAPVAAPRAPAPAAQPPVARVWSPGAAAPPAPVQPSGQNLSADDSKEERMDQARHYVCKECSTPVPSGHKFCGRCGAVVPPQILELRTDFFGAMQTPGKARLILIRGEAGTDGLSYLLQGTEHVAGRQDGQIVFPDDPWLSPRHANFVYRGDKLVVRDEGSANGVYVRVRGQVPIEAGDQFLCGEEVFRLERSPADTAGPDPDMTYFYSSPRRPSLFRLVQVLRGGLDGMVVCARESTCSIGREDCDLNFPEDVYMSANHARVVVGGDGTFSLVDNGSKNGTFVRIRGEREVVHGDYLFLGKQLLRVEITA